ncbi:hypothetical protein SEUCBS140593_002769 [Sporothrix eucalyptigena]|uniref:Uncharacterized protein n=1 Tax=Sporothrix eucalyptigena TaxID=1812306 RepID=A0ABP0B9B3_9PEZI
MAEAGIDRENGLGVPIAPLQERLRDQQAAASALCIFAQQKHDTSMQAMSLMSAFCSIRDKQRKAETTLDGFISTLAVLDRKWHDGHIRLSRDDFVRERCKLLEQEQDLLLVVSVMRTKGAELAGRWIDEAESGVHDEDFDAKAIDATVRAELSRASQNANTQAAVQKKREFREQLIQKYGARHPESPSLVWYPILHKYTDNNAVVQIVGPGIGELTARALFRLEDDEDQTID